MKISKYIFLICLGQGTESVVPINAIVYFKVHIVKSNQVTHYLIRFTLSSVISGGGGLIARGGEGKC